MLAGTKVRIGREYEIHLPYIRWIDVSRSSLRAFDIVSAFERRCDFVFDFERDLFVDLGSAVDRDCAGKRRIGERTGRRRW
ncbi:MAG: hypothetical protein AAFW81_09050 [Pseudomonadota bacterium]